MEILKVSDLVLCLRESLLRLEESLEAFERGVAVVRICAGRLQAAELCVRQLAEAPDGLRERPLRGGAEDEP